MFSKFEQWVLGKGTMDMCPEKPTVQREAAMLDKEHLIITQDSGVVTSLLNLKMEGGPKRYHKANQ